MEAHFSAAIVRLSVVKYGRCEPSNMEIASGALRNGDIGLTL